MQKMHSSSLRATQAFSLLEVMLSIAISAILLVAVTTLFYNLDLMFKQSSQTVEDMAMGAALERTISQDVHAASSGATLGSRLILYELTGATYSYDVNASHQVVRVERGGGTAVIGAHVMQMKVVSVTPSLVTVQFDFEDGEDTVVSAAFGG